MNRLRSFYNNYPTIKFAKGEIILHQHETPKHLYSVKNGLVQVTDITKGGDNRSISFETTDDIIPICWAFAKTAETLFYYTAYTDCELFVVDRNSFIHKVLDDPDFADRIIHRIMNAYVGTQIQVNALLKPDAKSQLLNTFQYLSLLYGGESRDNTITIQVPLTQQVIASFAGLSRETTSKELNKLRAEKIVHWKNKLYAVDIKIR
jgi:CRP/FNR family transcriptional regulator